jgi:hypothetical protein
MSYLTTMDAEQAREVVFKEHDGYEVTVLADLVDHDGPGTFHVESFEVLVSSSGRRSVIGTYRLATRNRDGRQTYDSTIFTRSEVEKMLAALGDYTHNRQQLMSAPLRAEEV